VEDFEKEQIRARTDLVELIGGYTVLKKTGDRYKGLCPFHQEKTPSFTVDPKRGRWHCFGACQIGGDAFTFLMKAENLSFPEVVERLAAKAGVVLSGRGNSEEARQQASERDRLYSANAEAARFFRESFQRAKLAQQYATARGLVHDTREAFQIGYAPDDWTQLSDFLLRNKIHPEDAVKAGLILPSRRGDGSYTDRFRGRLMFPIVDTQERVVGFGGRLIVPNPEAPKYLNSPETPVFSKSKTLYALNRAKKSIGEAQTVVVVEGYMDAVAAHQAGVPFVVATLGTALTDEHTRLIRRYTGPGGNVVLSFDADTAGVGAALKAAGLLAGSAPDLGLRVLALPQGEDPDSLIQKGNIAGFRRAIDEALTVPEFRLKSLEAKHDIATDAGRFELLREAVEIIALVASPLEMDKLVRRVAPFHPSWAQNSMRAEESVRAEASRVRQGQPAGTVVNDDPLGGVIPPPNRRGGPTAYNRNGAGQSGQSGQRYNKQPTRRVPFVRPDAAALPVPRSASEEAERTLLRAALSPDFLPLLRSETQDRLPPVYTDPQIKLLLEALWPLLLGHVRPADALSSLSDDLANAADLILLDDTGPALSEQVVRDALNTVIMGRIEVSTRRISEQSAPPSDEQLRVWAEQKRLNPRRRLSANGENA
jgi:DNA primase